jgi:hypothetical protein
MHLPTLIIQDTADRVVNNQNGVTLAKEIPDATFRKL